MSFVGKALAIGGLLSCVMLCIYSWLTSIQGVRQILGITPDMVGFIEVMLPMTVASLCTVFNGTSSFFFAMYARNKFRFTDFSTGVTICTWIGSVSFDCISSVVGLLTIFGKVEVTVWETMQQAFNNLGGLGSLFCILLSALMSLSPFIMANFGELIKDES